MYSHKGVKGTHTRVSRVLIQICGICKMKKICRSMIGNLAADVFSHKQTKMYTEMIITV